MKRSMVIIICSVLFLSFICGCSNTGKPGNLLSNSKGIENLLIDVDKLWAAGKGKVVQYDLNTDKIIFKSNKPETEVSSMKIINEDLWIATEKSLLRYDTAKRNWLRYSSNDGIPGDKGRIFINDMDREEKGNIIIVVPGFDGLMGGLFRLDPATNKFIDVTGSYGFSAKPIPGNPALLAPNIGAILSEANILWIADRSNLIKYDQGTKTSSVILDISQYMKEYDTIGSVIRVKDKMIIRTSGGIVTCSKDGANVKIYSHVLVSPDDTITNIAADQNQIYCSVKAVEQVDDPNNEMGRFVTKWKGMNVINVATGKCTNYSSSNGLPSNEIRSIASTGSKIFIATEKGVFDITKLINKENK